MIKIGIVDFYLDNWHTNHYPGYIRDLALKEKTDIDVCYAYAFGDSPYKWGLSTDMWCELNKVTKLNSYELLLEEADAIMVMGADDCRDHEILSDLALKSGKPVYCDKTFAPNVETADRMFEKAEIYHTPVFSCSAQRFCTELMNFKRSFDQRINFAASTGPGDIVNYSIHQYEMLEALIGTGAKRCKAFSKGETRHIVYEYEDDRMLTFTQAKALLFSLCAGNHETGVSNISVSDYYNNFFREMFKFFETEIPPVKREDTMEIMRLQQAARNALLKNDEWVNV